MCENDFQKLKNIFQIKKEAIPKNLKNNVENYIFELFRILQYKTENKFRKSHLSEPLGKFLTFP